MQEVAPSGYKKATPEQLPSVSYTWKFLTPPSLRDTSPTHSAEEDKSTISTHTLNYCHLHGFKASSPSIMMRPSASHYPKIKDAL